MENMAEALKMAFGIIMFVLALGLSISSFSQARETADSIITMKDRETSYTYVEPSAAENRIVSAETIIPTLYKAYKENFEVRFYKNYNSQNDNDPLYLYRHTDPNGKTQDVYIISLEKENHANAEKAINHLDALLGKGTYEGIYTGEVDPVTGLPTWKEGSTSLLGVPLYDYFKNRTFIERIGEYYQEDAEQNPASEEILDVNKSKKRVITYILQN